MTEAIIIVALLGFFVWKRVEKLKAETFTVEPRRLYYFPGAQFVLCALFCVFSLTFDPGVPMDEINQFVDEHEWAGDLSSALLDLDLSPDEAGLYAMLKKLHSTALYILLGSFAMLLAQGVGASGARLNHWAVEGIAVVHTACIFYMGNLFGKAVDFWISQMGTAKVLSLIGSDSSSSTWGMVAVVLIPFHYYYHCLLKKHYAEERATW